MALSLKGALVSFLPNSSLSSVITFQLNPETITHGLAASATAPVETFAFTLVLDASQEAAPAAGFVQSQISALQALLFPVAPQTAPPAVIFAWGVQRFPVRVTGLTITQKLFDVQLNPSFAEAEIALVGLSQAEIAALPPPMLGIANAAYSASGQAREQALLNAQTVPNPTQSSGGDIR